MKFYKKILNHIFFVIVLVFFQKFNYSQSAGSIGLTDVRSLSLGNSYTASSYGLYGLGTNPAAIFERKNPARKWELFTVLPLPNINMNLNSNFFNINEYNYFFGESSTDAEGKKIGRYLTIEDKQRFIDLFKDNGTLMADFQLTLFALSFKPNDKVGAFSFAIRDAAGFRTTIPKSLVELLLNGNTPGNVFDFSDSKLQSIVMRKFSLSYANSLKIEKKYLQSLNFGLSINFINGFAYTNLDRFNSQFRTDESNNLYIKNDFLMYSSFSPDFGVKIGKDSSSNENKNAKFSLFPEPSGKGLGFDIGFLAKINEVWTVGISITDMGKINWSKEVYEISNYSEVTITNLADTNQTKDLDKKIFGDDNSKKISSVESSLSTALHLGVAFRLDKYLDGKFPGTMLIVLDYNQGFNNNPGNSTMPRLSFGAEWIPTNWILEFRTGFSIGEFDKFKWAFGIGLDAGILEFNLGTTNLISLLKPNSSYSVSLLFDSRWRF